MLGFSGCYAMHWDVLVPPLQVVVMSHKYLVCTLGTKSLCVYTHICHGVVHSAFAFRICMVDAAW
jgi:hypothetical protein